MRTERLDWHHLKRFDMRDHEREVLPKGQLEQIINSRCVSDALLDGEDTIAIIGFFPMWEGVAEVWAIPSKHVHAYGLRYVRHAKREIDRIIKENGFRRLQTVSRADGATDKWMRILGFECEGLLRGYAANGDDYRMWARLTP